MLTELRVENYAVIDSVVVCFGPGLNLLTGETGAGKSILIDALSLLLGEKASSDVVRHGTERAIVSAIFEVEIDAARAVLQANGLEGDGDEIIVKREIAANGKGRVFVNNQPATVAVLKQLAPHLAIIHAQNQSALAFDAPERLALLDSAAGLDSEPSAKAYAAWTAIQQRIRGLERDEQDRLRMLDLWNFQLKEIDSVRPTSGEEQKLEADKRVLANAGHLFQASAAAYDLLYEGASAAVSSLRAAMKQVEELARFDPKFQPAVNDLDSVRITVEDLSETLRDYAASIDASPERLAEVEDRLAALNRLRRKYGSSIDDVLAFAEDIRLKINQLENRDEVLRQLRRELESASTVYLELARALSRKRFETARKLEKIVEGEINDLAMKARFRIEVSGSDAEPHWRSDGFDQVLYMISANPGEPLGPVEEIASGGELSRVMLALKASVEAGRAIGRRTNPTQRTLVFDEIDAGIGGRAADAVGKKLKALSRSKQVLCITHLPQIASFADQHFLIEKKESGGRTRTLVQPLAVEDRKQEIARMLSGAKVTEASLKNAEQMLKANA